MNNKHEFASDLPEFMNYYDYATSKLTGEDLNNFVAGQMENEGAGTTEHNEKFSYLYDAWLKEYKITHTVTDENNQVVHHIKYTELV